MRWILLPAVLISLGAYSQCKSQHVDDLSGGQGASDLNGEVLARKLVDHHQHLQLTTVLGSVREEVIRPDVVRPLRPAADAAVLAAAPGQSPSLVLFTGDLHAFFPPQAFDSLMIDRPIPAAELAINARTAEPRTPTGNPPHLRQELLVISGATLHVSLRPPRLLEHPADATLRNSHRPQAATHLADRASPPLGAHQFPWAASFRISMSKAWFATSFLSRAFSC